ncbi:PLxRFG domain-containing protein [Paracoccus methylarcula]|uniref:PLxRFG domain-containing protein n=1 Tax=Paracoccus methylarcula TaxID=72022 RepID=UPI001FE8F88A|nr:PLxRFG domain-containing protein [Paracoccus methylarcula]
MNSLALVPGRPLFTELGKGLSSAQSYLHEKKAMDAERNDWHGRGDTVAKQWWKLRVKDSEANNRLMDLMHKSTLSGLDPSKPDDWVHPQKARADALVRMGTQKARATAQIIYDEIEAREKAYAALKAKYDALPEDFQKLYRTVRDEYSALADATDAALIENVKIATEIGLKRAQRTHRKEMQRIKDEGLTGTERDQAVLEADAALDAAERRAKAGSAARMAGMRQQFESNRMSGPYFPLARFGTYFVTIRDNQGKVTSFSRFEKKAQQDAFMRDAEQRGLGKIEHGVLNADTNLRDMVDPRFVAEIEDLLTDAGADFEVMDAIWQHWLETLPDQSVRTNQIHRKGRAGFTSDAFRAFGKQMFHGAHQLARLKHGLKMEEMLNTAEEEAARSDNPERTGFVVQEMRRRHAFAMNPTGNPVVSSATSIGFVWYLGLSPAAALVNISQTTLIGTPIMAHRFKRAGVTGSVAAVTRAMRDFADGRGWSEKSGRLTDEEKSAMQAAYKLGTIDKTQAHDLASVADSGVEYSPVRQSVMEKIGWMFHHAERLNREVTFLANYRLSRREGIAHDQAIREASDLTWKIHFDYQNSSRPRFMQGDVAKVIFLFRSYTVNTLWRMFRDAHQTFNGASKEERAEARAQLVGITLSMMAHAGIKGVWGYGLLMGLLGLFFPGGEDDSEDWLQDALLLDGDDMGSAAWNYMMGMALNGAPGQVLGVDLTNRIGMPNLWFRDSGRDLEGTDAWNHIMNDMLGPVIGIGASMARGIGMASKDPWRGIEAGAPKFIRDGMQSYRFATEGAQTLNGDPLIEDMGPTEVLAKVAGFTPARLSERYDINNRLKNAERRVSDRRKAIHREIGDAIREGKPVPANALKRMREFNREWPEWPITADTIQQSVRGRMRASQRNEFGVSLIPKINDRIRRERAPAIYG